MANAGSGRVKYAKRQREEDVSIKEQSHHFLNNDTDKMQSDVVKEKRVQSGVTARDVPMTGKKAQGEKCCEAALTEEVCDESCTKEADGNVELRAKLPEAAPEGVGTRRRRMEQRERRVAEIVHEARTGTMGTTAAKTAITGAATAGLNGQDAQAEDHGSGGATGRNYTKDLTVMVEIMDSDGIKTVELLRAVRDVCGSVVGLRETGPKKYEITLGSAAGKKRLLDGLKIGSAVVMAKSLAVDELVVSFLNLPVYVTDEEILEKLDVWGVRAVSSIRRRLWPGTDVADGTRFLKVKFNDTVQSLPYSAKFMTATGPEYFRVIHNNQQKVCRMCLQPGHIVRDCPDFTCFKCNQQGHYARECELWAKRCETCHNALEECVCVEGRNQEEVEEEGMGEMASMTTDSSLSEVEEDDESQLSNDAPNVETEITVVQSVNGQGSKRGDLSSQSKDVKKYNNGEVDNSAPEELVDTTDMDARRRESESVVDSGKATPVSDVDIDMALVEEMRGNRSRNRKKAKGKMKEK